MELDPNMQPSESSSFEDLSVAFDLLNADVPSESDGFGSLVTEGRRKSRSFSDALTRESSNESGSVPRKYPLLRAINQELSQLALDGSGVSDKVKSIINKQRQRLDSLIEETTRAPRMLQSKITVPLEKKRRQFRGNLRKAVTGDPLKSVRLHLEETRSKPFMMRMIDKAAFTVGVLTLMISEYVLLLIPERFWLWYSLMIPVLLLMRYPDYRQRKWLLFYLDFCYYVQVCCLIAIFVRPHDCRLNKIVFMFTMGSLLWAVPLWRNSLVFHDVDKMTSCYIHLFPSWLALTLRWYPLDPWRGGEAGAEPECTEGVNLADVGTAIGLYILWQLLYYMKTEYQDRSKLDADPEIQTSLRWLTTSSKNPMHRMVLWFMRKLKLFKRDETFDPKTFKTKLIFMISQLVYTIVVTLPTPFLYNRKWMSMSLAFSVFLFALWNSSNYYIEVFSRRYWQTTEAEAAAKAQALLLKAAKVRERERAWENGKRGGTRITPSAPGGSFSELSVSSSSNDEVVEWVETVDETNDSCVDAIEVQVTTRPCLVQAEVEGHSADCAGEGKVSLNGVHDGKEKSKDV